jgi:hypothetical protein
VLDRYIAAILNKESTDARDDIENPSPARWSALGMMLGNHTARAIYVLPVAGYVILYSDYFQSLFRFSKLAFGGFLTFDMRVNLIYFGSLVLLGAFGLYSWYSPRLLRKKRDLHQFVSDIVMARDRGTINHVRNSLSLNIVQSKVSAAVLELATRRGEHLGSGAGEYEDLIPQMLSAYFNWQNYTQPTARAWIFRFALAGYAMVLLPSLDLFIRVMLTNVRHLFS